MAIPRPPFCLQALLLACLALLAVGGQAAGFAGRRSLAASASPPYNLDYTSECGLMSRGGPVAWEPWHGKGVVSGCLPCSSLHLMMLAQACGGRCGPRHPWASATPALLCYGCVTPLPCPPWLALPCCSHRHNHHDHICVQGVPGPLHSREHILPSPEKPDRGACPRGAGQPQQVHRVGHAHWHAHQRGLGAVWQRAGRPGHRRPLGGKWCCCRQLCVRLPPNLPVDWPGHACMHVL